ncbi:hypothetical protein ATE49_04775 [Elizabethkingia miricola]|uniref:Phage tail protein n=1 Tax=Elizabethkingia miricola TaxID=172045 RepID=A0ABY3NG64_ELIMR|nr:hypothetical protein [Elizabethkingia miricola]MCT4181644.1 hypothetical protein [Elizabethkingia anophelis]MDV3880724.1 hypothetical protein [Elizabethkingia anophelis]OBS12541.1 hypothetical protein ATE49_04775 [Elizabethkingia miricola]OPB90532.1 hypothetical protein BAS06_09445 [Elizabethkingia miricola]TYO91984.1 hypothetical protein LX74_02235 [Elizabethkingia miricola]
MLEKIKINGREYEWGDLTLMLGGRDIAGFRGFKSSKKVEREPVHAKGRQPRSIQTGNFTYEGEITMLTSEFQALQRAGKGTILSLMLDALLCYGNPTEGNAMTTKRVESLMFTAEEEEWKQGDKFAEVSIPFVALFIDDGI